MPRMRPVATICLAVALTVFSLDQAGRVGASRGAQRAAHYTNTFILPPGISTVQQLDLGLIGAGEYAISQDEVTVSGVISQSFHGKTTCFDLFHYVDASHAGPNCSGA